MSFSSTSKRAQFRVESRGASRVREINFNSTANFHSPTVESVEFSTWEKRALRRSGAFKRRAATLCFKRNGIWQFLVEMRFVFFKYRIVLFQ